MAGPYGMAGAWGSDQSVPSAAPSAVGGGAGGYLQSFGGPTPDMAAAAAAGAAAAAAAAAAAQARFGGGMMGSALLARQQLSEEHSDEFSVDVSTPTEPSLLANFAPPRRRVPPERQLTCLYCGSEEGALLDCGITECGVGGGGCQRHGEGPMVVDGAGVVGGEGAADGNLGDGIAVCGRRFHFLCAWFAGAYVKVGVTEPSFTRGERGLAGDMDSWPEPGQGCFGFPTGMSVEVRCLEHSFGAPGRKGAPASVAKVVQLASAEAGPGAGPGAVLEGTTAQEQSELRSKYRFKVTRCFCVPVAVAVVAVTCARYCYLGCCSYRYRPYYYCYLYRYHRHYYCTVTATVFTVTVTLTLTVVTRTVTVAVVTRTVTVYRYRYRHYYCTVTATVFTVTVTVTLTVVTRTVTVTVITRTVTVHRYLLPIPFALPSLTLPDGTGPTRVAGGG